MTLGTFRPPSPSPNDAEQSKIRLLDKIAKEILVCENRTIRRWEGSIGDYKKYLRKKMVDRGAV